ASPARYREVVHEGSGIRGQAKAFRPIEVVLERPHPRAWRDDEPGKGDVLLPFVRDDGQDDAGGMPALRGGPVGNQCVGDEPYDDLPSVAGNELGCFGAKVSRIEAAGEPADSAILGGTRQRCVARSVAEEHRSWSG